jgi:hypothetical protein
MVSNDGPRKNAGTLEPVNRKRREFFTCAHCGREFLSLQRPTTKRYCSTDCQIEGQEPKDLPDEQEIRRRALVIRELTLAGVKITKARLDWYD